MIRKGRERIVVVIALGLAAVVVGAAVWLIARQSADRAEQLDYGGEAAATLVQRFGPGAVADRLWEIEIHDELNHATCGMVRRPGKGSILFAHRIGVPGHLIVETDQLPARDRAVLAQCGAEPEGDRHR